MECSQAGSSVNMRHLGLNGDFVPSKTYLAPITTCGKKNLPNLFTSNYLLTVYIKLFQLQPDTSYRQLIYMFSESNLCLN